MRTTNQHMMGRKMLALIGAAALVAGTLACNGDDAIDTRADDAGHDVTVTEVAAPSEMMGDVTLYAPDADGSWPVTVLFAGSDSPRSALDPLARALAAEGVVVATTETGTDEELLAGEYECSQRLAVLSAWEHGADPNAPIAVGGHDIGAGMAVMASAFDPFYSLAAGSLLDCGLEGEDDLPPMDLVIGLGGAWTPGECDGLSGEGPEAQDSRAEVSEGFADYVAWADSNPSVPILIAHGTADPVCSIELARAAADDFEANGHPVELLVFEGGGHADGMLFLDDENDAAAASADPDAAEGRQVVSAIVAALSAASASGPEGQASLSMGVETIADLEYLSTETESFALDVYQPDGEGPFPVLVLFHGSTPQGKDSHHTRRMAEALAASGLVVFAPTWNVSLTTLTGDGWQESMDRASCALAYAEEHAPDHGADPSALATIGWSAGAQPAAWLALGHGTPGDGCAVDTDPTVPNGAVLIDSEYFLHTDYFQRLFDNDAGAASAIVAGFIDPTTWSTADDATFRLVAAETQGMSVRSIGDPTDPTSWLAERDADGSLITELEGLGALEDGQVDYIDQAMLLQLRLERAGVDATFNTVPGDHTDAVCPTNDATLIVATHEATGAG
jgi:acetyl esterase/lipase